MTTSQGDLAALSRYVFRAPRWYTSTAIALVVAAIAGAAAFTSAYVFEDAVRGVVYIGLPTAVAALVTTPLDRALGGRLTFERSSLLALTCEVVLVVALLGAGLLRILGMGDAVVRESLLAGLAFIFALRLVAVLAISRTSWLAILPASVQTVSAAVALALYDGTMRVGRAWLPADTQDVAVAPLLRFDTESLLVLVAASVVFGAATYGFVVVIDRPWRRAMGISVLDFISGFLGHIAEGSRELEEFFAAMGETAVVPVTVLVMRRPDGTEKARWTLPMVHPGPMGEIGGGNLPRRLAETAEGLCFPPHATAGHDFNLVSRQEVETLVETTQEAAAAVEFGDSATHSVRATEGDATVTGQRFTGGALLVTTYAPGFADDVAFAVGQTASAGAQATGLDAVMLADAHNSNNGLTDDELGHVTPGSQRAVDTVEAANLVGDILTASERQPLRLGTAWSETPWSPADGIGSLGVRVAVVGAGSQTTAYVLIDGNNMEPGLRAEILAALPDEVDSAEVLTTDTHVVTTVESVNQVGENVETGRLIDLIADLTKSAIEDLEPVEAGMASESAEVTVFGNDRTEALAAHANSMVAMGAGLAVAFGLAALALTIILLAAV